MAQAMLRAGKVIALVIVTLMGSFLGGVAIWVHAELGYPVGEEIGPMLGPDFFEDDGPGILSEERYEITEKRNTNQRVWEIVREVEVLDSLTSEPRVEELVSNLVQVGDGICYQDSEGQWQVSDTQWQTVPGGFVMDRAGYKLRIGNTIGTWLEYEVDGHSLFLRPVEIMAYDGTYTETIGTLNETAEAVISSNDPTRLVFASAFGAGIDLEVQAGPGGYHQNIVFRREPTLTRPFDPDLTEVLIYTEINVDTYAESGLLEVSVGAGGRYAIMDFTAIQESAGDPLCDNIVNDMEPTIEDIRLFRQEEAGEETAARPLHHFGGSEVFDSGELAGQRKGSAKKQIHRDEIGSTYLVERLDGRFFRDATYPIVWDYSTVNGTLTSDTVWYARNTYYVDPCSPTLTVDAELKIEPGTYVKMGENTKISCSWANGRIIAKGQGCLPIVFTSANDNCVGEPISGGSGSPQPGDYVGVTAGHGSQFEFCLFWYAERAICVNGANVAIQHSHFYYVERAIWVYSYVLLVPNDSVTIFNNLIFQDCVNDPCFPPAIQIGSNYNTAYVYVRNNTIDRGNIGLTFDAYPYPPTVIVENNIFSECATGILGGIQGVCTYNHNGYYNNTTDVSPASMKGADSVSVNNSPYYFFTYPDHYLNDNVNGGAEFLNAGNGTPVSAGYSDPNAWSIRHIYPEHSANVFLYPATISSDTTWEPVYDTCDNDDVVDIGYHHPRIDYIITMTYGNVTVDGDDVTLTVKPGTVLAHRVSSSTGAGKLIVDGTGGNKLVCTGEPFGEGYVTWVEWNRLQHSCVSIPYSNPQNYIELGSGSDYYIRFSKFLGLGMAVVPSDGRGTIRDSIFMLNTRGVDYQNCDGFKVENCLFMGNTHGFRAYHYNGSDKSGEVTGCTFDRNLYGVVMPGTVTASLTVEDCLFHSNIRENGEGHGISYRNANAVLTEYYNSFYGNNYHIYDTVLSEPIDTDPNLDQTPASDPYDFAWTDFADRYRLDQTGDTVNNGSVAEGGMVGYTTALDDTEDANELDIGYHYPLPIDTDGDGLYDYEEFWLGTDRAKVDSDGDGLVDGYGGIVTILAYPDGIDADDDGYVDGEADFGTDLTSSDTDEDGIPDGWEILYGLDPLNDSDGEYYLSYYQSGDNPNDTADDVQAVLFSGSGTQSKVRGLTIRYAGGAAVKTIDSANPTIERCIIENASYGIIAAGSSPNVLNNQIRVVTNHGIRSMNSVLKVRNNLIYDNGLGIAISKNDSYSSEIINNTIVDNGLGLMRLFGTPDTPNVSLVNCIIYGNGTNIGLFFSPTSCWFEDPGFAAETYLLDSGSDCIDAGSNQTGQDNEKDIGLTDDRIINSVVDIGADEYDPS